MNSDPVTTKLKIRYQNMTFTCYYHAQPIPLDRFFTLSIHNIRPYLDASLHLTTIISRKTTPPTILRCRRNVFTKLLPGNNKDMDCMENDAFKNSSIAPCIRCCGNVFTEPLSTTEKRGILRRAVTLKR
jgi:hypothetical protein